MVIIAVVFSLAAGACLVIGRSLNSRLSAETGVFASTMYNYLFGLAGALVVMLVFIKNVDFGTLASPMPWWVYTGGALGVTVVTLLNVAVSKISSFYMTLLTFIGQMIIAVILDIILSGEFSLGNLLGCAFVAFGFGINLWLEHKENKANAEATETKSN